MFKSIHPFDQSLVGEFPLMNSSDVQKKLDLASKAFADWRKTSFAHRAGLMLKVASIIRNNKEEYARTIALEMGKLLTEARAEVEKSATVCEYFAQHAEEFLKDQTSGNGSETKFCSLSARGRPACHYAVEFSLLASIQIRGTRADGGKCGPFETCTKCYQVLTDDRKNLFRSWLPSRSFSKFNHRSKSCRRNNFV